MPFKICISQSFPLLILTLIDAKTVQEYILIHFRDFFDVVLKEILTYNISSQIKHNDMLV